MRLLILAACLAGLGTVPPAAANTPLRDVPRITEGIIAAGIAYEIGRVCDDIGVRWLRGVNFLYSLERHAVTLGYSEAEVEAFVDSKAEQDRLEAIARARLADKGAVVGQPATYCAVGRAEIAARSQIGQLLR